MGDKMAKILAVIILGWMFILMFASQWNESATMDELAHIPSGYSYMALQDYRLNPEHPPLIKDLSAVPLLFLNLNFPTNVPTWTKDVNGQWDMGRIFIYESGNDADKIIHFSRFTIMLLAIIFGWLLFNWTRKLYGNKVGLMTIFLFATSPTFIAHSRYVTTDLGASFGFFIGLATFINFLRSQTKKNLIIAGIAFGVAQLLKFSLVVLIPIYFILAILWVLVENRLDAKKIMGGSLKILAKVILIGIIGAIVIWPIYQFHILNYPLERQIRDTQFILSSFGVRQLAEMTVWMADKPILRPFSQYLLGLLMVIQRAAGGNDSYFLGTISAAGSHIYFPLLYIVKETLPFLILAFIALIFAIKNIIKAKEKTLKIIAEWIHDNFAITAAMIFIFIYMGQSISSSLNIGIRHIMPIFPFMYLLVSRQIVRWAQCYSLDTPGNFFEWLKYLYHSYIKKLEKYSLVFALLLWIFLENIMTFPFYLSYYNELGGGTRNGYKIAVDSNYDWGQDLKRLKDFIEKNNIQKIAIDYFGGGNPSYYFGTPPFGRFEPWWSSRGEPPPGTWFAISLTFLQGAQAKPVHGFYRKPDDTYYWLKDKEPVSRAGTSIFIYKF
ncbi:MAG: glycosyltransferase family 39 protein [Patescibacteria group bacterium]